MKLSIIILNYKTCELVKQCLKNIVNLNLQFKYEIIVVDNNSNDEIEKIMREEFPIFTFAQTNENKGMGAGNNVGIKKAKGEYILILNPDVVVWENSIENLLNFIEQNEKIGCVAPKLLYPNKKYQQSRYRFPDFFMPALIRTQLNKIGKKKLDKYLMNDVSVNEPHKIDWARGSALLSRKKILDKIQGFDERYFMYLEDTDLCRKIWKSGSEIWFVPDSKMTHYYFRESGGNAWLKDLFKKMAWIHIGSWLKYFIKWRRVV
ncbi:glycosyltransferase family 2 protein [Patescibacteria group bacterium]|nr:glycosyltransferase family 2 protein [Patescibacteria group bacterium]